MKKIPFLKVSVAAAIIFTFNACKKNMNENAATVQPSKETMTAMISEHGTNPDETILASVGDLASTSSRQGDNDDEHFLYTESNNLGTNSIIIYKINKGGTLQSAGNVISGGSGTGKGLGSQGALAIDEAKGWLYAVNAGCNSVSSFKIGEHGKLTLAHSANTYGKMPVSVSMHDNLLYVLDRGSDNIEGFKIGNGGKLTPIAGSVEALSSTGVDAPQISFTPNGNWLVVTEKATNIIGSFKVKNDGSVNAGKFTASVGQTPFGFDFARNFIIVSDAAGGAAGAGASTSYNIYNGMPSAVNGAVGSSEAAPCWVATTKYGRFAYVSNTASNNISSYYVSAWGALYLVHGEAAKTDGGPADIVVAENNYDVFELNAHDHTIGWYQRKPFGELAFKASITGLPVSTTGIAVY